MVITSKVGGRFPTIGAFVAVGSGIDVTVAVGIGIGVLVGGAVGVGVGMSNNETTRTIAIVTLRTVTTPAMSSVTLTITGTDRPKLLYQQAIWIAAPKAVWLDPPADLISVVPGNKLAAIKPLCSLPLVILTIRSTS
ncbi:hypothetical protein COU01_04425 [Candidatus Falkowbacteria bacterium CG10_big_fil_rev_8_21_14_0_10_44_15]|uniref:Uncharacterized protein n=1 Tax=Candidatus Falkowbacteria bacterium CG10_big_fil_rev_8_21_14_0_10_44_15 TaxID=1974569 RepID=A0A2H0UYQ5_9BACT|nr:MAG: hypothetical protein COU01_04425 [Candidatus Falkowbacteria bacterium CG10_big_fil_rev_8_21_14_0_10_44_15]